MKIDNKWIPHILFLLKKKKWIPHIKLLYGVVRKMNYEDLLEGFNIFKKVNN